MTDQQIAQLVQEQADAINRAVLETRQSIARNVRGSRDAIEDCLRRQREAQKHAQDVLGTYEPSPRAVEWAAEQQDGDDFEAGEV